MSGVKGRSGRRPRMLDKEIDVITARAWERIKRRLNAPADDNQADMIAKEICVKAMITKQHVTGKQDAITVVTYQLAFDKAGKPIRMPASVPDDKALVPK